METQPGITLRWPAAVLTVLALIMLGAGAAYLALRPTVSTTAGTERRLEPTRRSAENAPDATTAMRASGSLEPLSDVIVPLTDEAVARAGIEIASVGTGTSGSRPRLRIPGTVQPNAYRSVTVTPLVAGRMTRVMAELGQRVAPGATLAEIYSPELAEAQTRFLSSTAELSAHEQELRRTEKLVEIGAASRRELEKIHAEHTGATTMVETNRARLTLLGMSEADIARLTPTSPLSASVHVRAPVAGVVTARTANPGLNVDATTPLFTLVDLSTVWIAGDLYERDFSAVRVGSVATATTTAYPDLKWEGKVSYIDPQVKPETRTAQVRIEVPNPKGELRLGMYAEIQINDTRAERSPTVTVPRSAVQVVANRSVVYVVNPQERGRFVEREVRLGDANGDDVEVVSGIQASDVIVAKGSFAIRAERERLGLRAISAAAPASNGLSQAEDRR